MKYKIYWTHCFLILNFPHETYDLLETLLLNFELLSIGTMGIFFTTFLTFIQNLADISGFVFTIFLKHT